MAAAPAVASPSGDDDVLDIEQADIDARKTLRDSSVWTESAARAFVAFDSHASGYLELRDRNIVALPSALFDVRHVTELHLKGNRDLRDITGVERMRSLIYLDVSECDIFYLPQEIGQLSLLTTLVASCNTALNWLPDSIGDCSRLRDLLVGRCGLEGFPASLSRCTQLRRLCCWQNFRLSTISTDVLQLPFMEVLQAGQGCDLDSTTLIAIAEVLRRSTTLRDVGILDEHTDLYATGVPEVMAAFERASRSSTTLAGWRGPRSEIMHAAIARNRTGAPAPDPYQPLVKPARNTS